MCSSEVFHSVTASACMWTLSTAQYVNVGKTALCARNSDEHDIYFTIGVKTVHRQGHGKTSRCVHLSPSHYHPNQSYLSPTSSYSRPLLTVWNHWPSLKLAFYCVKWTYRCQQKFYYIFSIDLGPGLKDYLLTLCDRTISNMCW